MRKKNRNGRPKFTGKENAKFPFHYSRKAKLFGISKKSRFFQDSKGQAQIVMHALTVAFSLVMIWIIVSVMNSLTDEHKQYVAKKEILQTCDILKTGTEKIMVRQDYVPRGTAVLGKIYISMPEKIGGLKYRTSFLNDTMIIETIGTPTVNDTCVMGFNATFRGGTNGGKTEITRLRYNNGTDEISIF